MKKWLLVAAILVSAFMITGCSQVKDIPTEAIDEILELNQDTSIADHVEIKEASDRDEYCYVMLYISYPTGEIISLEEAIPVAEEYTMKVAKSTVAILEKHDVSKDVNVWAQLQDEEGGITVLGHTKYDGKTYTDFERYQR